MSSHGKKLNLNTIIIPTIKSLKGMYAESMDDAKVAELDNFVLEYEFRVHEMYASARYKVMTKSMNKAGLFSEKSQNLSLQNCFSTLNLTVAKPLVEECRC